MNELERALRACQDELEGHVTRVEETSRMQKAEVEELQKHVSDMHYIYWIEGNFGEVLKMPYSGKLALLYSI